MLPTLLLLLLACSSSLSLPWPPSSHASAHAPPRTFLSRMHGRFSSATSSSHSSSHSSSSSSSSSGSSNLVGSGDTFFEPPPPPPSVPSPPPFPPTIAPSSLLPNSTRLITLCNSWNMYGNRVKLREYPRMAGPIHRTLGNFSQCWSLTASFIDQRMQQLMYLVLMDGDNAYRSCQALQDALRVQLDSLTPQDWVQLLGGNYTYTDDQWVSCCNTSNFCNEIVAPPGFAYNTSLKSISTCNAFNNRLGYRFYSNPYAASPITHTTEGPYNACYAYTVQLSRAGKTMYYSQLSGYDPDAYDGVANCEHEINKTLLQYQREDFFEDKFNYTFARAWAQCCNSTNSCNTVVGPPNAARRAAGGGPALTLLLAGLLLSLGLTTARGLL